MSLQRYNDLPVLTRALAKVDPPKPRLRMLEGMWTVCAPPGHSVAQVPFDLWRRALHQSCELNAHRLSGVTGLLRGAKEYPRW